MLRLTSEDEEAVQGFQKLHAAARDERFGRLLRSPTVWEDLVKCILLCNCGSAPQFDAAANAGFPWPSRYWSSLKPSLVVEPALGDSVDLS